MASGYTNNSSFTSDELTPHACAWRVRAKPLADSLLVFFLLFKCITSIDFSVYSLKMVMLCPESLNRLYFLRDGIHRSCCLAFWLHDKQVNSEDISLGYTVYDGDLSHSKIIV